MKSYRKSVAEVNLHHFKNNIVAIHSICRKPLMAVIKANAYGHGAVRLAKELEKMECVCMLGLATVEEAIELRNHHIKKEILILGPTHPKEVFQASKHNVTLCVYSLQQIKELMSLSFLDVLKVHIKLDTGMNRIGFKTREEFEQAYHLLSSHPFIQIKGVFTHFGASEEENETYTLQINKFKNMIEGYSFDYIHCDNSAGTMYHHDDFTNMDRLGIGMYGIDPKGNQLENLKPVMTLKTQVLQVKKISKGEKVGYNFTYTASNDEYVATLPIGYADGLIRKNQGRYVMIHHKLYPIIGRICMDQMMVRVDESVKVYDEVEIFGEHISINTMAKELDTIPYEIMCLLSQRIERVYIGD